MPITLNHTIVPSHNKEASAKFFARIFGLEYSGMHSHFAPVRINGDTTFDWDDSDQFEGHHYAFVVSDDQFDAINRGDLASAKDTKTDPQAVVEYTPKETQKYLVRVRLYGSRENVPCVCLAVVLVQGK